MTLASDASRSAAQADHSVGMAYLDSLPRRVVTVFLPLAVFVFVLLFPFYWMAITAVKPNHELTNYKEFSPFWVVQPTLDGASPWQRFWHITLPMLSPIIAVVMTFSVLFTFTDFQLIYVLTRGGPVNATHLMATLSFQRAIPGGQLGEGAAIAVAMIPFLLAAILFSYFGLQRRGWQSGGRE